MQTVLPARVLRRGTIVIIFTVESPRGLTTLYTGSTEFFGTAAGVVLHPPMTKVIRRQKTKITFSFTDTACFFINIPPLSILGIGTRFGMGLYIQMIESYVKKNPPQDMRKFSS